MMEFQTDYRYIDRKTKAKYVWLKYQAILNGCVLDVGADEGYLKEYLDEETKYWGIGLGGHPDQIVNLEKEKLPFPDNSYDCVLCLDVLEHLANIHKIFDELCRVSRQYVVISLPNPWASFFVVLRGGNYHPNQPMKYYGLPPEPPEDRHKWFFSYKEAQRFILHRASENNMKVLQLDIYQGREGKSWKRWLWDTGFVLLTGNQLNKEDIDGGVLWAVLQKEAI